MRKTSKDNRKGFTLVELIVVLVILAILAAILVPALLGWIDRAKSAQDYIDGRALMTAMQAQMTEEYGLRAQSFSNFEDLSDNSKSKYNDIFMTKNPDYDGTMEKICELAGIQKPFLFLFYTKKISAATIKEKGTSALHDAYTIISAVYWKDKNSKPVYYNFINNTWEEGSPYSADLIKRGSNMIQDGSMKDTAVRVCIVGGTSQYVEHNENLTTRNNKIKDINNMILKVMDYNKTKNRLNNKDANYNNINNVVIK